MTTQIAPKQARQRAEAALYFYYKKVEFYSAIMQKRGEYPEAGLQTVNQFATIVGVLQIILKIEDLPQWAEDYEIRPDFNPDQWLEYIPRK